MVPVWPSVVVAFEFVNWTVPKSASDSGVQLESPPLHVDGASAIHSALAVSGLLICSVLENDAPLVAFDSDTVTFVPSTVTLPVMWSPGCTTMFTFTGAEGTSSYQAK